MTTINPTYSFVPPGWNYNAVTDAWYDSQGRYVTKADVINHGSFTDAVKSIHGAQAILQNYGATGAASGAGVPTGGLGANGSAGPFGVNVTQGPQPSNPTIGDLWADNAGDIYIYTQQGWKSTAVPPRGQVFNASISSAGNITASDRTYPFNINESIKSKNVLQIETDLGRIGINIETGDITVPPGIGRDEAIREFWFGFQKNFIPTNKVKYENEIAELKNKLKKTEDAAEEYKKYVNDYGIKTVAEKVRKKYGNEKFIMVKPEDLIKFIEEG